MKPHVMLINTGRGALIDTKAIVVALKSGQVGSLGLDVYEQESELFFEDLSIVFSFLRSSQVPQLSKDA